jgi:hypothetical protein
MMMTNEEFMAQLQRDFPEEDWDSVPDPDTQPDIYVVSGWRWTDENQSGLNGEKIAFSVEGEFTTREDAETQVERCKRWPGVIPDSLSIQAAKPAKVVWKHFCKESRSRILVGENVFPMYLP